jgi:hypothetical protein
MIDGVILSAISIFGLISIFSLVIQVLSDDGGTKGITQPYTTKSGVTHTAKKERSEYII